MIWLIVGIALVVSGTVGLIVQIHYIRQKT